MIFGYARVSSHGQQLYGNSLEVQHKQLVAAGCEKIIEEQYTGSTTDRPLFNKLNNKLKAGDTLIVTKLDRLSRSVTEGVSLIKALNDRGVNLHILNFPIKFDSSPMTKMIISCMLVFAEFEREMILERTKEGLEMAKQKPGFRNGRTPFSISKADSINYAVSKIINGEWSYRQAARISGFSVSTLVRYVKKEQ